MVLGPTGLFLVEIKSRPRMVRGDMSTWAWTHEARTISTDNPLLLANRKAKRLASLLCQQKALAKIKVPFVEPLVFLSAPHVNCMLTRRRATASTSATPRPPRAARSARESPPS